MSIFVTGSTGTIGQAVVGELLARGATFRVGVRSLDKAPAEAGAALIDYEKPETLINAFSEVETLFLLTPDAPQVKTWVQSAVEAAKEAGIRHIVRSSDIGSDINSSYKVMRQLGELEKIIQESGLAWTFLRPNSFMQNFATFDSQAVRHGQLQAPRGNAHISFVDVRDIAAVTAEVLVKPQLHGDKAYTLTGPRALALGEVSAVIGRQIGKDITYSEMGDEVWAEQMRSYGLPDWDIELLLSLYQADKDGVTAVVAEDVEQVVGRTPYSFEAFVKDYRSAWV